MHFKVMMMKGPLGFKGRLVVDPLELRFEPVGLVERSLTRQIRAPLAAVATMAAKGVTSPRLKVTIEGPGPGQLTTHTFYTRRSRQVLEQVAPFWARALGVALPPVLQEGFLGQVPEGAEDRPRARCTSVALWYEDAQTVHRGWLALMESELLFLPLGWTGGEREPLALALDDLFVPAADREEGWLELDSGAGRVRFLPMDGERFCEQVRQGLTASQRRWEDGIRGEAIHHRQDCMMMKDPLGVNGELQVSSARLLFRPRDGLNRKVLSDDVSVSLAELARLTCHTVTSSRLEVSFHSKRLGREVTRSFYHRKPLQLMEQICPHWLQGPWSSEGADDTDRLALLRLRWSEELSLDEVTLAGRVLMLDGAEAARGWLVLSPSQLLFLALDGPGRRRSLVEIDLDACRAPRGESATDRLDLPGLNGRRLRFLPADGAAFCRELWTATPGPLPARLAVRSDQDAGTLESYEGDASFVRVVHRAEEVLFLKPGRVTHLMGGVGLLLRASPERLPLGRRVTVEIGRPCGYLQFHSRALYPAVSHEGSGVEPGRPLLVLEHPRDVTYHRNRRATHRVPLNAVPRVEVLGQEATEGTLRDLSSGGLSMVLPRRLEIGTWLTVTVPLGRGTLPVTAEVVSVERASDETWQHGCAFQEMRPGTANQIDRAVQHHARQRLQRRNEDEERPGLGVG